MQLKSLLCTIQNCEDQSAQKRGSFPEDKCYNNQFFIVFNDTIGVIPHTGFRRFLKWFNCSPYIYSVMFTELLSEVANPIIDWLLYDLEQPLQTLFRGKDVPNLFSNIESKSATIASICEEESSCLSKHFDSTFNRISNKHRRKSFSFFLPRGEVIGRRNTQVIQASLLGVDCFENTLAFPPWRSSSDGNSNLGVLEDFFLELFNNNLQVPKFSRLHHEVQIYLCCE